MPVRPPSQRTLVDDRPSATRSSRPTLATLSSSSTGVAGLAAARSGGTGLSGVSTGTSAPSSVRCMTPRAEHGAAATRRTNQTPGSQRWRSGWARPGPRRSPLPIHRRPSARRRVATPIVRSVRPCAAISGLLRAARVRRVDRAREPDDRGRPVGCQRHDPREHRPHRPHVAGACRF